MANEPERSWEIVFNLPISPEALVQLKTDVPDIRRQSEISGFNITISCMHEIHGTYDGETKDPASLIVLEFRIRHSRIGQGNRRVKELSVGLLFEKSPKGYAGQDPYLTSYSPGREGKVYLTNTLEKHADKSVIKTKGEIGGPAGPVNPKVGVKHEKEHAVEYEKASLLTLESGFMKTRKGARGPNKVWWKLVEDSTGKTGVPDTFALAMLVKREKKDVGQKEDPFNIELEVSATVDLRYAVEEAWKRFTGKLDRSPIDFDLNAHFVGKLPPNAEIRKDCLKAVEGEESGLIDELTFMHLPEQYTVKKFYEKSKSRPQNS